MSRRRGDKTITRESKRAKVLLLHHKNEYSTDIMDNEINIELAKRLASLQLPHQSRDPSQMPSIKVMIVSDIDLKAASDLAEYTLEQKNQIFDASRIDLCIACGPLARDEDLLPYLKGKQKRDAKTALKRQKADKGSIASPFSRTREETSALEGILTATLSQLESIVCRVLYCPGATDPITAIVGERHNRLTPNSRNIHRQWLPLVPGLGCAALVYFESPETSCPPGNNQNRYNRRSYSYDDDDDEDDEQPDDRMSLLRQQLLLSQLRLKGYLKALERLLSLAPVSPEVVPLSSSHSQSILITHYVNNEDEESRPWPQRGHDEFCEKNETRLALEIASGQSSLHPAKMFQKGDVSVLMPGSLRKRGEFCLLDLKLEFDRRQNDRLAWRVNNVDFHKINRI